METDKESFFAGNIGINIALKINEKVMADQKIPKAYKRNTNDFFLVLVIFLSSMFLFYLTIVYSNLQLSSFHFSSL